MQRFLFLAAFLILTTRGFTEEPPPNIVIVFTDDQGYEDVGVFGAKGFTTPHLDKMASEAEQFLMPQDEFLRRFLNDEAPRASKSSRKSSIDQSLDVATALQRFNG